MKKIIFLVSVIVLLISCAFTVSSDTEIKVFVNGEYLKTTAPVLIVDGRTMVPMRDICEAMGYSVDWNSDDQSILVSGGREGRMVSGETGENIRISLKINAPSIKRLVKTNSPQQATLAIDVPPQLINGKTYLPVRALSEALFFNVQWNQSNYTVHIDHPEFSVGSTSAGQWSKLMMCGEYDSQKGFKNAGLMDLQGNIIIPYGPAPTYEEVLERTDLFDIIDNINYTKIEAKKDKFWAQWDYMVNVYGTKNKLLLTAKYALDGTVHYAEQYVYKDYGREKYMLRSSYNPNTDRVIDSLYLNSYEDNSGNKIVYHENGEVKAVMDKNSHYIDISFVKR